MPIRFADYALQTCRSRKGTYRGERFFPIVQRFANPGTRHQAQSHCRSYPALCQYPGGIPRLGNEKIRETVVLGRTQDESYS